MAAVPILRHEVIDSTQLEARRLLSNRPGAAPPLPLAVVAAEQSGGRGREGRRWHSPRGGLWVTGVWPAAAAPDPVLGLRVGLAVLDAVAEGLAAADSEALQLKWPNDVLLHGRKVAGILTETVPLPDQRRAVLVGVGINANVDRRELPEGLAESVAILREVTGRAVDLEELLERVLGRLALAIEQPMPVDDVVARAVARLHARGECVALARPDGSDAWGTLDGLDARGEPILLDASGARIGGPFTGTYDPAKERPRR